MTLNTSNDDRIAYRRELVGRFRLQGLSLRQIAIALREAGMVNPDTGNAYDAGTIKADVDALKREWRKNANIATEQHIARQLAELQEVKRIGFAKSNLQAVLRAIEDEMKLLGTPQPDKTDLTSGGDKLGAIGVIAIDYRSALYALAPTEERSVQDSDTPG